MTLSRVQSPSVAEQWTTSQWEDLRRLMETETGMELSGSRAARLTQAVDRAIARLHCSRNFETLIASADDRGRLVELIAAELTVGESFFFRNEHHFDALRSQVIPSILDDNRDRREVRIWSAGCATGEEPYSLAILMDQVIGADTTWNVSVLGTDLNPAFLERARQGAYRSWSFRRTTVHENRRYFTPEKDAYRITDPLRARVRFSYLNLVKDPYPSPLTGTMGLDLILFRNVAIYLKSEVTAAILARFCQALRPGGWLLLGETEVAGATVAGLDVRRFPHATFYRKPANAQETACVDLPVPVLEQVTAARVVRPPRIPEIPRWSALPFPKADVLKAGRSSTDTWSQKSAPPRDEPTRTSRDGSSGPGRTPTPRATTPKERAAARLADARQLLERGETGRCREQLALALRDDPLSVDAHLLQAVLAEESGELDQAERGYRRVLYLDRSCAIGHFHLATIQQQRGDGEGAARSLATVLRLSEAEEPQEIVPHGDGMCYGRLREMALLLLTGSQP